MKNLLLATSAKGYFGEVVHDEEEDDDEIENQDQALVVAAISLGDTFNPNTMRIMGKIKNVEVVVLIDTGSTHNFISSQIVQNLQLPVLADPKVAVKGVTGEALPCQGRCRGFSLELPSYQTSSEFFVISMSGVDVVLGIEWLRGFGSIVWNFKEMVMSFVEGDKTVVWCGQSPSRDDVGLLKVKAANSIATPVFVDPPDDISLP